MDHKELLVHLVLLQLVLLLLFLVHQDQVVHLVYLV